MRKAVAWHNSKNANTIPYDDFDGVASSHMTSEGCLVRFDDGIEILCRNLPAIIGALEDNLGETNGLRVGFLRESHEIWKDAILPDKSGYRKLQLQ